MRITDTSDRRSVEAVRAQWETDLTDPRDSLVEPRFGNAGENEILPPSEPDVSTVISNYVRDLAHLTSAHHAEVDRETDVERTGLLLLVDSHVIAFAIRERHFRQCFQLMSEPRFDELAKLFNTVIVYHEFETGLHARDAVLGSRAPNIENRSHHGQRLFAWDERPQM